MGGVATLVQHEGTGALEPRMGWAVLDSGVWATIDSDTWTRAQGKGKRGKRDKSEPYTREEAARDIQIWYLNCR